MLHTRVDPVDIEPVVCVVQFVCDEFQAQDLLVGHKVWSADVNVHFRVTQLVHSAICHHFWEVPGGQNDMHWSRLGSSYTYQTNISISVTYFDKGN